MQTPDIRRCSSSSVERFESSNRQFQRSTSRVVRSRADASSERQVFAKPRRFSMLEYITMRSCRFSQDDQCPSSIWLAGIKGYGTTSGEFLPLVAERLINLETLDLLGCTHLFDTDFQQFAEVLDNEGRVSPLSHLIISGCASLGFETFYHLAKRMPNLINLEAAGMPDAYGDRDADDQSLVKLLRSVTRLEKLDLEGTGLYGGVTDRVIDILTPAKGVQGIVGRNLVELRIGFAREVTSEALIRLVRGCTKLRVLEADVRYF